jgi:N-acylneuraminate cytidylyltransferase
MNVAFIPVRGGSKSIPLKNIKSIAGHPLVYWTAKAANDCEYVDVVYVATDSDKIKTTVEGFGLPKVRVIERGRETATDSASTESAMLEFAARYEFDNIVLVQATSPLLTADDLNGGFRLYETNGTDSVLSVVEQKRFIWKKEKNGCAMPQNYDVYNRPRRQEFDGYLVENGAFYITGRERLIDSQNRISGNIKAYAMNESTYFEIDEPDDWIIAEKLLASRNMGGEKPQIKMFLTDCDGCLTDGGMYYSENGDELKKFNTKDGMGIRLLREKGIITGIITGENVDMVARRAKKLKIDELHMGIGDKLGVVKQLSEKYSIPLEQIAYFGDDVNDLECIIACGHSACPADALPSVAERAGYICSKKGGDGAVREYIDFILKN